MVPWFGDLGLLASALSVLAHGGGFFYALVLAHRGFMHFYTGFTQRDIFPVRCLEVEVAPWEGGMPPIMRGQTYILDFCRCNFLNVWDSWLRRTGGSEQIPLINIKVQTDLRQVTAGESILNDAQ